MRVRAAIFLLAGAALFGQDLTDETYVQWRDHVLPKPAELQWQKIPWRATFWQAVLEAQQKEQPILLWAMNGHPLACT